MRKLSAVIAIIMLMLLASCGKSQSANVKEVDEEAGKNLVKVLDAQNQFAFHTLPIIEREQGNVLFSPTSLWYALSMVYNGTDGDTKEEIAKIMQVKGLPLDELNEANELFFQQLQKQSKAIQLHAANSAWVNQPYTFQSAYKKALEQSYHASTHALDFSKHDAADRINAWVRKQTNKKIEEIVEDPIEDNMVLYLLNALYFNGKWQAPFNPNLTTERPFTSDNGIVKNVNMMSQTNDVNYLETDDFQAVALSYGEGEMSMQIFLPKSSSSLELFEEQLTMEHWRGWKEQFTVENVVLLLPKFTLESDLSLNETLKQLGMPTAFQPGSADLSKMIEQSKNLYISEVRQKTFVQVDEEGTEAAATTSVGVKLTSAPEQKIMEVNRPFFFTIVDEQTDAILFMGSISNPK